MNRRQFLKHSAVLTLPLILQSCDWLIDYPQYPIYLYSDANTGHLIRASQQFPTGSSLAVETLIVGGGIAGLSAACHLSSQDFVLCELSDRLGGSSSSASYGETLFSQGAHYDLAYPHGYGEEVLSFLERLNIVKYQFWSDTWSFTDRSHIIFNRSKSHCYDNGKFRNHVLEESNLKNQLFNEIAQYKNQMYLPTRLISNRLSGLNKVTFVEYLKGKLSLTPEFLRQLDYHLKDDYGAATDTISALAGVHYFMCRPYYQQVVELFSPPEGNYYFIKKMADQLPTDQLKTQHLVQQIKKTGTGYEVEIVDVVGHKINIVRCHQVIYAGQKHALSYIHPESAALFASNRYAPWIVVNVVLQDKLPQVAYWQNEMLTHDKSFMGFTDSGVQQRIDNSIRTLSGYYCLPESSRNDLLNVEKNQSIIAKQTIQQMSNYFQQDLQKWVLEVHIKVMGHAMPIPTPNYLLDDKNTQRQDKNFTYAGVDNGRLPLLYEAIDSGIGASNALG